MAIPLRALIVEDSEDDAALIVRQLRRGGFAASHVRVDTAAALDTALRDSKWDVVISDYSMPGFSGAEALRLLRAKTQDIPFIYVSGTLGEDTAVAALKSGAQDYLLKGNLRRLVPAIERELREAEGKRERKRLETQIHQLQRFEAIGRLAGGIAHDFNNVIGAIMGWAEIGQGELPEGHSTRERLQNIQKQAERAASLTRQLLAFARRQILQPQNLDLNLLVTDMISLLRSLIGEHVKIAASLTPDLPPVWADASQIEQVIMNLCLNARDAIPEGGRLLIHTEPIEITAGENSPRPYFRPGKYVLLSISDTGVGMDEQTLEHIFEPFFTTKEVGKGTGLGLSTVYGIVKQHNGIIDVESKIGLGTRVRVYLPIGSGLAQAVHRKSKEQVRGGSETILVAEDHDGLREAAREMLESLGYRVLLARSGEEALEVFNENHATISLVLLDVVLPTMSGPSVLTKMAVIRRTVRAIFTTGYATEANSLAQVDPKGITVLQKPYTLREMAQKIRSLLDEPH